MNNIICDDDYFYDDYDLSKAELAVAKCLADGLSNIEIAETLHISIHTAKLRIHKIVLKTGARNRTQAIAILAKNNML